jgi:DNA-binding transcriptional MerR regulator
MEFRRCHPFPDGPGREEHGMSDPTLDLGDATVAAGFPGKKAAEIVGISYRQLDYWARTDLIRPSLADATGSGSRRRYSYRDLLELKLVKSLLDAGIRLEQVREAFTYVRENLDEDVTSVNLVLSGSQSVVVRTGEELIDLVRKGQGVLNVLPLAGVKEELDAKIVELFPSSAEDVAIAAGE